MRAHTPPFTKPEAAYDSRRLYEETSAIAAAQDARHAMTDAEREAKLRTVAHYIYHAKLLMDEVFGTERAKLAAPPATPDFSIVQDPPDLPLGWLARGGAPVESAYLASFGPNDDMSKKSPKADTRVASVDEVAALREHLTAEQLREYGIGDVEPATLRGIPDSFTDSHGSRITRRVTPPYPRGWFDCVPCVEPRHPMHAEALRQHDERLNGPEDSL
ncbi:hypothetical protein [Rhodanobacter lindaniclasticus]|uniref:Uncharacterized protein n=1 Tax=Rhodanobacter lindaniclasticus TaxID=75310 RepID=A0A4V3USB7_9GAMM|nr:hypothetical protein [Rhodanobacter lindaniclasticus]THD06131.1 hypothetical protein B1991_14405 [Rhodanobacter lindaniclasticus]